MSSTQEIELLKSKISVLTGILDEMLFKIKSIQNTKFIGEWIPEDEAITRTSLSKSSLLRLRKTGKISSSKFGKRKVFYRVKDLEKLLNENEKLQ